MENIPERFIVDQEKKTTIDLTVKNVPCGGACFICDDMGKQIKLKPKEGWYNKGSEQYEPVENTGCTIAVKGGCLLVTNLTILEWLMAHPVYLRGSVRVDPTDPTGFWRVTGKVRVKTIEVAVFDGAETIPEFKSLNVKNVKPVEEKVEPLYLQPKVM